MTARVATKIKICRNPNIYFPSQDNDKSYGTFKKNQPFDDKIGAKFEEVKILIFKVMTFEIKV